MHLASPLAYQLTLDVFRFIAQAEEICELGLAVVERPELRGRLFEWSAISAANLGRSRNEVVQRFDQAVSELPFDQTIRKNFTAFESGPSEPSWFTESIEGEPPSILTLERQLPANAESSRDRAA